MGARTAAQTFRSRASITAHALTITGPSTVTVNQDAQWSAVDIPLENTGLLWSFGDGATATGPTVAHSYSEPGEYTITVEAAGERGILETASTTVVVKSADGGTNGDQPQQDTGGINQQLLVGALLVMAAFVFISMR